jgi:ribosomal protein L37E
MGGDLFRDFVLRGIRTQRAADQATAPGAVKPPPSFRCPDCGHVSYHPIDVAERYCGACHRFFPATDGTGRI